MGEIFIGSTSKYAAEKKQQIYQKDGKKTRLYGLGRVPEVYSLVNLFDELACLLYMT